MAGGEVANAGGTATGTKATGAGGGTTDGNALAGGSQAHGGDNGNKVSVFEKIFSMSDGLGSNVDPALMVRIKGAHESYDGTRREQHFPMTKSVHGSHPRAGERLSVGAGEHHRYIDEPSQRDKACMGAFLKWQLHCNPQAKSQLPRAMQMTDHDWDLVQYTLRNYEWAGTYHGDGDEKNSVHLPTQGKKLADMEIKAILDDSTSGGAYAEPIYFDDMIIQTPLLYGQFFPAVNVVPITRGRLIQGASIGNMTLTGGGADGTDIPLFTTTSFIGAFNTTIFVANGGIQIGLDYLSDSPVDVAGILTEQYGRVLLNYLDKNVAAGDGTTQPTGITVAAGTVSVAGGSAAPTVGVYEAFFFGVALKYKQGYPNERIMFGANETTYARARAIAVSGSDARRIFGMTHGDYMLMGHKYGISDTLANTKAFFGNMARYRMYRRLGQTVKVTTEGQTLVRGNLMLLTARSRWGGQPEDGGAFAVSSTMQS